MEKEQISRRAYLINPDFQLKFVGFSLLMMLISLVFLYFSNLYFVWKIMDIGHSLGLPINHPFFQFVAEQKKILNTVFAFSSLGVSLVILLGGIFLSHRVAGPISRIDSYIQSVLDHPETPATELSFRKSDFFPELAELVNRLVKRLNEKSRS